MSRAASLVDRTAQRLLDTALALDVESVVGRLIRVGEGEM